jgi:phosphatidylglycerophosphate synthase
MPLEVESHESRMIAPTIRWHAPKPPLRTSILLAGGLGLLVVIGVALTVRAWFQLGATYPVKAAAVFAAIIATVFAFIGDHHPFTRLGAANHVTGIRALLVALMAGLIGEPVMPAAALAAAVAAGVMPVLDGVDGWLARRSGTLSAFGARFDMEVDALHVLVMSVLIWQQGKAGAWVLLGGSLRYAFVVAGWLLAWMARPLRPTRRAKTITICHMATLSVSLAPFVPAPLSAVVVGSTLAALTWSFAVDVHRLWRQK